MIGPRASNDAEAFADALDGRGPRNGEVQDLVRFAESLCEAAVDPAPEFLQSLRSELMSDASSVLVKAAKPVRTTDSKPAPHPLRRRLAAATALLVAAAGMVGLIGSSAQALPGDMLYPVKRSVESVQLQLHRSEASRGSFQLEQASERLSEAQTLAKKDDARSQDLVAKSLADFTGKAESGSQALFSDYSGAGEDSSIDKVNTFAAESSSILSKLSDNVAADNVEAYDTAAAIVAALASQAADLCNACEEADLSSLARTVGTIADQLAQQQAADSKTKPDKSTATTTPPSPNPDKAVTTTPPPESPVAEPTPELPIVEDGEATKPIIGAIIGDDTQVGLVPGLLGGLLGGNKK